MKQLQYEEAVTKLEELVAIIEDPNRDLSTIGKDVKQAMELIKFCKESIVNTKAEVDTIINDK